MSEKLEVIGHRSRRRPFPRPIHRAGCVVALLVACGPALTPVASAPPVAASATPIVGSGAVDASATSALSAAPIARVSSSASASAAAPRGPSDAALASLVALEGQCSAIAEAKDCTSARQLRDVAKAHPAVAELPLSREIDADAGLRERRRIALDRAASRLMRCTTK